MQDERTIPDELKGIISSDPQILGGTPCFKGTRVPLATFLDHIESGHSLDRFLKGYSSVHREQATAVLEWLDGLPQVNGLPAGELLRRAQTPGGLLQISDQQLREIESVRESLGNWESPWTR